MTFLKWQVLLPSDIGAQAETLALQDKVQHFMTLWTLRWAYHNRDSRGRGRTQRPYYYVWNCLIDDMGEEY